ncbi:PKD domain-containing protein [Arcticibacter sp. MXS-1]|uniref:PKD domain-containing protein n=1 Tax=Arcticibacter sp. MXS-1 TaxID=3341726 RepID=UPI0035A837DD
MRSATKYSYIAGLASILAFSACSPEEFKADNAPAPTASFTATPLAGQPNKIVLKSTTENAFLWNWDFGNGVKSRKEIDTVLFDQKGTYAVKLVINTKGGAATVTQNLQIENDYPGVNILPGGDAASASQQYWTVLNTGGTQTNVSFANNSINFSNSGDSNGAIFQAVDVKAGKSYALSARVSGQGASNSWMEIDLHEKAPVQGTDYGSGKVVGINTWTGCGKTPFDGNIFDVGCDGPKTKNIQFSQSGKVYLVIKAGSSGGTLGAGGITVRDIKLNEK